VDHDLRLEGYAFTLRPVQLEDAAFIVDLRTSDPQRVRYLHAVPRDAELQRQWLARYFERAGDYYWVLERRHGHGEPEGLVGIYDLDPDRRCAVWGRWVLRPGSLAAPECALLIYRAAFELLQLDMVYSLTAADNVRVLSFHESCGLQRGETLPNYFDLDSGPQHAVKHICTKESWPAIRERLAEQAQRIAARIAPPK